MTLVFRPAAQDVFDDVVEMLGPKRRPDALACWCLTYRLGSRDAAKLDAHQRRELVHEMCGRTPAPGVLAYTGDGTVVGWAGVAPRSEVVELQDETVYPRLDDDDPWAIFCLRVRAGHRRSGIGQELLEGAVRFAQDHDARAVEGYPVDTDQRIEPIRCYPGLRSMFERAGLEKVADIGAASVGLQRVLMRRTLT